MAGVGGLVWTPAPAWAHRGAAGQRRARRPGQAAGVSCRASGAWLPRRHLRVASHSWVVWGSARPPPPAPTARSGPCVPPAAPAGASALPGCPPPQGVFTGACSAGIQGAAPRLDRVLGALRARGRHGGGHLPQGRSPGSWLPQTVTAWPRQEASAEGAAMCLAQQLGLGQRGRVGLRSKLSVQRGLWPTLPTAQQGAKRRLRPAARRLEHAARAFSTSLPPSGHAPLPHTHPPTHPHPPPPLHPTPPPPPLPPCCRTFWPTTAPLWRRRRATPGSPPTPSSTPPSSWPPCTSAPSARVSAELKPSGFVAVCAGPCPPLAQPRLAQSCAALKGPGTGKG